MSLLLLFRPRGGVDIVGEAGTPGQIDRPLVAGIARGRTGHVDSPSLYLHRPGRPTIERPEIGSVN
jgi:hypothetical protein